ncbi:MAG TPA: glutamate--tRNA ligase [Firmicutes bacterium]|nr:glutamate--tRNA ligase [Bacillota bacterium]
MELKRPVRVRMAPSPTGDAHVGHARTTLYNYLFARKNGGTFILRIDDTDTRRNTEEAEAGVYRGLRWLGLDWDEGPDKGGPHMPYRQSERLDIYHKYVQQLLDCGAAYECFCTNEELEAERQAQMAAKEDIKYSGKCRDLTEQERQALREAGRTPTVRLKVPSKKVGFQDLVRGWIEADASLMGDFIILKSDGMPVYNFATVIDDHLMQISQVTRGAEHISNTFPQILIYEALGFEVPQFAHFSLMLNEDRTKMSKRMGATFVGEYAEMGYLPEAMLNFLAFLGWSPGGDEDEILTMDDLLEKFSLEQCTVSNAIFDIKKLDWINAKWIRRLEPADLAERIVPFLQKEGFIGGDYDLAHLTKIALLIQERLPRLDAVRDFPYLFLEPEEVPVADMQQLLKDKDGKAGFQAIIAALQTVAWQEQEIESAVRAAQADLGWSNKELFMSLRLAICGGKVSPPLFPLMEIVGRDSILRRLERAVAQL